LIRAEVDRDLCKGRTTVVHDDGVPVRCAVCGRELQGDRDDDPYRDEGPTCGECARDRDRDHEREDDFVLIDLFDGELDGHLG
jgi:hypothetical protein